MASLTAIKKRKMEADYLNVGTVETPEYALCGTGFTALTETPSAQTSSKKYINMDSARQSVTSYEWTAPFEADQIQSEKALAHILDIAKGLKTGGDVETDFVQVDLDEPVAGAENTFAARKRTVAIAVSEMPDNDGEMGVNGDFLGVADPVFGTFNTVTKEFTEGTTVNPKPALGELEVTTTEGENVGETIVTVTPAKQDGNSYKYKVAASPTMPVYDQVCSSGYTNWDGTAAITAASGQTLVLVEVDGDNKAKAAGSAAVNAKEE